MNKTKIYQIKSSYNVIASFEDIEKATKFFAELVKNAGRNLEVVRSKGGEEKLEAHYWGGEREFSIVIQDVELYQTKKDAEFAVFKGEE